MQQQEEQTEHIIDLISKTVNGTLADKDREVLEEWKNASTENAVLFGWLTEASYRAHALKEWDQQATENELLRLNQRMDSVRHRRRFSYGVAAAITTVFISVGIYLYILSGQQQQVYTGKALYQMASNISPGGDRATLTLSDGKVIDLAGIQQGVIVGQENGNSIHKNASGELIYNTTAPSAGDNAYNTLQTPKGAQFTLRLPDGTEVWLNAASSLRYALNSQNGNRVVELDGEAYFEVAHDPARPFIVRSKGQQVQVLGTHFNVNSYGDEGKTLTTLLEGRVQISSTKSRQVLVPGQQAQTTTSGAITVQEADSETALAWKNGRLEFRDADLPAIMRQIARWYDIGVSYNGTPQKRYLTGSVSRKSNLSAMLKILSLSNISFELKEDKAGNKTLVLLGENENQQNNTH